MDYRAAFKELSNALWAFEKAQGEAFVALMKEYQRIENNLDKSLPPIRLADEKTPEE